MAESSSPRTLADQFRQWSDADLARLLAGRPDLATPAPQDSSQLASRAGTRASAMRAVDQLTVLELTVIDAIVAVGGSTSLAVLQERVNAAANTVSEAVEHLLAMALLWGSAEKLRALSVLSEIIGTTVSRLGPTAETLLSSYGPTRITSLAKDLAIPASGERQSDIAAIADHLAQQANVDVLLSEVGESARKILDHLEHEATEGSVESTDRPVSRKDAQSPVDQLLARGLLIARDRKHVAVPREVAIALRGGKTTPSRVDIPPALATTSRSQSLVDRAAGGAAFEFVRHVELLLEHWGTAPPSALRAGGLGVRDLRGAAELLHVDDRSAALHIEVAAAADLIAVGKSEGHDAAWLPTDAFDIWNAASVADRWGRLALAWLNSSRLTGLIGGRDDNKKPVNALVPDLEREWLPDTRRLTLAQVAELEEGQVLATETGTSSLAERLTWLRPRRPVMRSQAVLWALDEAAIIGVMALGGLSVHGRKLLSVEDPKHEAPAALEPLLPQPIDHVLIQADLTAVAPGPLDHDLAHNLATMADIESREAQPSTGSRRRRYDGRSTRAGPRPRSTSSSPRRRGHRFHNLWCTSLTTCPGSSARFGWVRPSRSCAVTTSRRWPSSCTTPRRRRSGCAESPPPLWSATCRSTYSCHGFANSARHPWWRLRTGRYVWLARMRTGRGPPGFGHRRATSARPA